MTFWGDPGGSLTFWDGFAAGVTFVIVLCAILIVSDR